MVTSIYAASLEPSLKEILKGEEMEEMDHLIGIFISRKTEHSQRWLWNMEGEGEDFHYGILIPDS